MEIVPELKKFWANVFVELRRKVEREFEDFN